MDNFFKNRKIKVNFAENIEPQEVILDNLARKREEDLGISEKKFEVPLSQNTIIFFVFIFILSFLVLFSKTFILQVVDAKNMFQLSEDNSSRKYFSQSKRGIIYDNQGNQLVFNNYSFDLILDKRDLSFAEEDKNQILIEVCNILQEDLGKLKEKIDSSLDSQVLVYQNIPQESLLIIESKIEQELLPGFNIEKRVIRDYKDGEIFSHLIGYLGRIDREEYQELDNYSMTDYIGKLGIEKRYEQVLRGVPSINKIEKDALGNKLSEEIITEAEDGKSLVLWLDSNLQRKIKEELQKSLNNVGGEKAAAIAINPKTGGVLALVSLPSFDNNLFSTKEDNKKIIELLNDPLNPIFNRVISGKYLTGSTIKPLISIAALEENIIDPDKKINSPGFLEIPHKYNPEITYKYRDNAVHGWVNMKEAIARSVNVYFYVIGGGYQDQIGLGPTRIKKYLEMFGWNKKTGIDLPGEVAGFIPDPDWKKETLGENWWDGDTYYLSIGQQYIQITPLEVVNSFVAIANGGTLYEPKVVQKIINGSFSSNEIVEEFKPKIVKENFINKDNLEIVREGMRQTVTNGSATGFLNHLPFTSAAKTGTAELGNDRYNNWITVFAPYEDPEIVITFLMEESKTTLSTVSPVARDVLDWYFSR